MAIVFEEEKNGTNWVSIIGFIVVSAVILIGGYYLFFKKPELIDVIVPERLREIGELSTARFDPRAVVETPSFKSLKDYAQPLAAAQKGRENPFKP